MLRFLRIARLAVIDAVEVEFEPGFNVLTGETGAGKSILVGAVGLLLGGRASGDLVRTGEDTATVEAIFERGNHEIVIRREVTAQGRSRAFVDGTLVTAGALKDLAGDLIELHGQHEHQTLLDPSTHLASLDAFARLDDAARRTSAAYTAWRAKLEEAHRLRTQAADRSARQELAAFQFGEIDKAAVKPGEDDELSATRRVLLNASRIKQLCGESYSTLYESDESVMSALGAVWKRVADLASVDPSFEPYLAAREGIKAQLEDLAVHLRRYADGLEVSPARLQEIEERLSLLDRLKRKYGPTLNDVITRRESLAREIEDLDMTGDRLQALDRDLAELRSQFTCEAGTLSQHRREAAPHFTGRLVELLAGLALDRARFEVRFNTTSLPEAEWHALGTDHAEFFISLNPGEELRPLARIVSGGELSRVMLALKTMTFGARLSHVDGDLRRRPGDSASETSPGAASKVDEPGRVPGIAAPGMIFDEVDAGIGGRVAEVVGRRLRRLGSAFQVLCITHLPQVAACADAHFLIEKHVEGERTRTRVTRLTRSQRIDELARMLAGSVVSDAIRASAREMLEAALIEEAKGESTSKGESETRTPERPRARRGA